jgi:MscS family membrane protein
VIKNGNIVNMDGIQGLLCKFCETIVWSIALTLVLKTLGYNISALLAGLGLGGAALALASKDTLANFFGSITVFFDRPFRIGDRIKITGFDGVITAMGIRTSKIKTTENRIVFIPNSIFAVNPIENFSTEPEIKVTQLLNVKTDNGLEKITQALVILKTLCSETEGCGGNPQAGVVSVNATVCQISFVYFVKKDADYLTTVNRVNLGILNRFQKAGIVLG